MVSLKRFFRSLVVASKGIQTLPETKPILKLEEGLKEKSKLEKEVEGYITLPLPETLTLEEMKKIGIKRLKKVKNEKLEKLEIKKRKVVKKRRIVEKKVKKKTENEKARKIEIERKELNKKELKNQLQKIEKSYEELRKKGYSDEDLKIIRDKISSIKKRLG